VQARLLPAGVRLLLPDFLHNAHDRAAPDYEARVRRRLFQCLVGKDYPALIKELQDHPFVLSPGDMAGLRALACESLGRYRPAAAFYADALRLSPPDPALLLAPASIPLTLPHEDRLDEAWEYARHQLDLIPNVVSYAVASLLCFGRAQ